MLLSKRENTSFEEDGAIGDDGDLSLAPYADHVADAIPQLIPLVDQGHLALGIVILGLGMGAGLLNAAGLSTIGGGRGSIGTLGMLGLHKLSQASVLAPGSIVADL